MKNDVLNRHPIHGLGLKAETGLWSRSRKEF
jgi:hypothetical protein